MDENDDFQALFFLECDENLEELQKCLDSLPGVDADHELVNAAFRSVHSIKGGAAAFGFEALVGFAHEFETVMDRLRSGAMALSPKLCQTLLRAADVMTALVEAARDGTEGPVSRSAEITAQLRACLDGDAASAIETAPEAGAPQAKEEVVAPVEIFEDGDDAPLNVEIIPGPDFLVAGFDPLRLIRAARAKGLMSAKSRGSVPPITAYAVGVCPLSWEMEFDPETDPAMLEAFFSTYAYGAEVQFSWSPAAPPAPVVETARLAEPVPDAPPPPLAQAEDAPAIVAETQSSDAPTREKEQEEVAVRPSADSGSGKSRGKPPAAETKEVAARAALRVDLTRVDQLVNLVGEVLIAQAAVAQTIGEVGVNVGEGTDARALVETLTRQTRELQESVMAIRAQPVRAVFSRLPRVVRDLADMLGKDARLVTAGEEVEVDTTVIEELTEPLIHMLRNSMDHGIETPEERRAAGKPPVGTINLSAEQRGGRVHIILQDDGRGINHQMVLAKARARGLVGPDEVLDVAAIEALIFHPGFSTAETVSAVSGRGVGMDVVRRKIQELGGRCLISSVTGKGTTFTITLPLTLAIMDGMAVRVDGQQYILPLSNVIEAITIEEDGISELPDNVQVVRVRDSFLPLLSLRDALALPGLKDGEKTAIVVDTEVRGPVVILVDDLLGQRQIVLKNFEENVGRVTGVGGATILGNGEIALILDVPALFRLSPTSGRMIERIH